jgi:hypothetical protein
MFRASALTLLFALLPLQAAQPPIRIGLDTQATEWVVQLEGVARSVTAPGSL